MDHRGQAASMDHQGQDSQMIPRLKSKTQTPSNPRSTEVIMCCPLTVLSAALAMLL